MPREITVSWVLPSGTGSKSVLYFANATAAADNRDDLDTFLDALAGALDSGTTWVIDTAGREWDDNDGSLIGAWTDSAVQSGGGSVSGEPMPDATQGLFRWNTDEIADGRFVVGRTFIPGIARVNAVDGNFEESVRAAIEGSGNTFLGGATGFGVWHRPRPALPVSAEYPEGRPFRAGSFYLASSCSVWNEFAVLRRRRG